MSRSVQGSPTAKKEMGEKCGKFISAQSMDSIKNPPSDCPQANIPATKEDLLLADGSESRGSKRSSASTMAMRSRRNPTEFSIWVRSTMECVHLRCK